MQYTVTHSRKDRDGDIIGLGKPADWYDTSQKIINHIESGRHTFIVAVGGRWVNVIVKQGTYRKYLATTADGFGRNNLDNLPPM